MRLLCGDCPLFRLCETEEEQETLADLIKLAHEKLVLELMIRITNGEEFPYDFSMTPVIIEVIIMDILTQSGIDSEGEINLSGLNIDEMDSSIVILQREVPTA